MKIDHALIRSASQNSCTRCGAWVHALMITCSCGQFCSRRCDECGGELETEMLAARHLDDATQLAIACIEVELGALFARDAAVIHAASEKLHVLGVSKVHFVHDSIVLDVPKKNADASQKVLSDLYFNSGPLGGG